MGYWGKESPARGGEHRDLAAICERAFPFPLTEQKRKRRWIYRSLQTWINARQQEAKGRGTIAAAKYPQLCRAGRQLFNLLGDRLRVIAIERPIEESIKSIQRRAAKVAPAGKLAEHQRWLEEGRQSIPRVPPSYATTTVRCSEIATARSSKPAGGSIACVRELSMVDRAGA